CIERWTPSIWNLPIRLQCGRCSLLRCCWLYVRNRHRRCWSSCGDRGLQCGTRHMYGGMYCCRIRTNSL
ncbi:hypothetical protein BGZ49_005390, partial [Haplosporangium sp. Z 27]